MTSWMLDTLIATSLLMLAVLVLRKPVARRFGTRTAYWLWLAPAVRMVLPPLPDQFTLVPKTPVSVPPLPEAAYVLIGASSPASSVPVATDGGDILPLAMLAIWLGGAALFIAYHLIHYRRFVRRMDEAGSVASTGRIVRVSASPLVSSPLAYGIVSRNIIVPQDFDTRFSATERRLALVHELTHHRRGDPMINLAALLILALHWFNPIAHFAYRAFRLDQEAACDAIVLRRAGAAERQAYGNALFKAASGPVPLAACAMSNASMLKTRLRLIASRQAGQRPLRFVTVMIALLATGGALTTASRSFAAETVSSSEATPKMIVLGGGIINSADNSTTPAATDAEVDEVDLDLDVDAVVAEAKEEADAAIDAAEASAEAEAAAAIARDEADGKADDARQRRVVSIQIRKAARQARAAAAEARANLAPPAPPAPPAAPDSVAPPAPPSPEEIGALRVSCPKGSDRRVIKTNSVEKGKPRSVSIVICAPDEKAIRTTVREALETARATIADEKMLDKRAREQALAALDRELANLDR